MAAKITNLEAGLIRVTVDSGAGDGKPCIGLDDWSVFINSKEECADLIDALRIAAKQLDWDK